MGIKALLRRYAFSVFAILCITVLLCGIISVRERTQYNMDLTEYEKLEVSSLEDSVIITAGKRKIEFRRADFDFFK